MVAGPDRDKALDLALAQIDKQFGKGSVMRLGERTVDQALAEGWEAKRVWREVWKALELPARDR